MRKVFIFYILLLIPAFADEVEDKSVFKRLYAEFNELYETSVEIDPVIAVAEKLYKLAPKAYGKSSEEYAIVIFNLAGLYDEKGSIFSNDDEKRAVKLYREYFKLIDKLDVARDFNYLNNYFILTTAAHNVDRSEVSLRHEKKILKITDDLDLNYEVEADINFKLAELKINASNANRSIKYFRKAHELYLKAHGPDHIKVADTLFWLGKIETSYKNYDEADKYYSGALRIFELEIASETEIPVSTHAFLANLYETVEKSEEATKHVIATAITETDENQNIRSLYQAPMVAPQDAPDRAGGYKVVLNFTIDKVGRAKDIIVTQTDDPIFNENSITSLEKFRFTPTMKNGELTDKNDVSFTMHYFTFTSTTPYKSILSYGPNPKILPYGFGGKPTIQDLTDPNLQ